MLQLWNQLKSKNYKFLLTRHLNQDCLENFYGQVRNACGNARNPTAIQFSRAFKKLFALKILNDNEGGNCIDDATQILLTITPELLKKSEELSQINKNHNLKPILKVSTNDYSKLETQEGNAFTYVGGYFLRKCFLKHSCDVCLHYSNQVNLNQSNRFCQMKAYEGSQGSFGGLTVPPNDFFSIFTFFRNHLCPKLR